MKAIMSTLVLVLFSFPILGFLNGRSPLENEGIIFQSLSFNEAKSLAKESGKPIFIDFYATWCGPCKRMKSKTFSDPAVANFYNQNFINLALDAEKGEGLELAKLYGVKGYPTLLFVNGNGEVINKGVGFHKSNQLLSLGQKIINKGNASN